MNPDAQDYELQGETYESVFSKIPSGSIIMWMFVPVLTIIGFIGFCLDLLVNFFMFLFKRKKSFNLALCELCISFTEFILFEF